jgi:hypothetical protein
MAHLHKAKFADVVYMVLVINRRRNGKGKYWVNVKVKYIAYISFKCI